MMLQGHGRLRRRKETLRVTQLVGSQSKESLDVVTPFAGSTDNDDTGSGGVEYGAAKSCLAAKYKTARSLGRKETHRRSLGRKQSCSPSAARCPKHEPSVGSPESDSEWSAVVKVFVPAGGAAGIAFQWSKTPIPGMFVVGVTEGSLAAGHGSIVPGMLLLEIGERRVVGISQDETMRAIRSASGQTRVLTLARKPRSPLAGRCSLRTQARPEDSSSLSSVRSDSVTEARLTLPIPSERFLSVSSSASCVPRSSLSSPDGETSSAATSSVRSSVHADLTSAPERRISNAHRHHAPRCERTLDLRFVGSREDITSLYDRDHVLGVKKRDIEFIPTSGMCSNMHRANSQRSLGDLTLDWRRDPFSTPARRRRLINDVCELVVSSYAQAAASRVSEFRKEEAYVACIQAAVRMWSAWNHFRVELAERRRRAALILQLGWLAHTARRRTQILREENNLARSDEEIARKKRLMRERDQEKLAIAKERMEQKKRRCEQASAVFLQTRFRAVQKQRRLTETKRIQDQQRVVRVSKAAATIHATFRRWRRKREASARISRDKMVKAACLIQRTWCQHKEESFMNRPKPQRSEHSDASGSKPFFADQAGINNNDAEPNSHVSTPRDTRATAGDPRKTLTSAEICPGHSPTFTDLQASGIDARGLEDSCLRPWNAARTLAMESVSRRVVHAPPTGMMAVRVKIGSERRNWFTPVVSRESDQTAPLAPAGTGSASEAGKNNNGRQPDKAVLSMTATATGALGSHVAPYPTVLRVQMPAEHPRESALKSDEQAVKTAKSSIGAIFLAPQAEASQTWPQDKADDGSRGEILRSLLEVTPSNSCAAVRQTTETTEDRLVETLGGLGCETSFSSSREKLWVPARNAVAMKNTQEQWCIMEDSQVYLGCARCGLKYLVESVDARLPDSGSGQPAPEVLYLCTTCGGTLRHGEDGRWQRRRRPSSAPAVGRRSAPHDGDSSSRRPSKSCQIPPDGSSVDHALEGGDSEITAQESYEVGSSRGRSITVKLRYARCARIIQLAYQKFRHQQYLRDWALRVFCRWFPGWIEALRRAKRRLQLHLAAVALQSFARAAFARARSSLLRSARRRLWMDRAAALHWGLDDDTIPSPGSAELLRELDASPSLPSPRRELASNALEGDRCRVVGRGRLTMAKALAPMIKGPPPPGCPAPLDVDWGECGIKLKLAFSSRVITPDY